MFAIYCKKTSRLRLGVLPLRVETDRYQRVKIAACERYCKQPKCSNNAVTAGVKIKQELPTENQDDGILPDGWKIENDENSEEVFINPAGKRFTSRRDAVEFMIKNGYAPKSIYNLWNSLDSEGWLLQSDQIPAGWRVKYYPALHDYKYLTREMNIIHSTREALLIVKSCDDNEQERFENWLLK